jgi:NADH-quinone oxidoreductase subunit G
VRVERVAGPAAPEPTAVPVQVAPAAEGLAEMPPSAPLPSPPREVT